MGKISLAESEAPGFCAPYVTGVSVSCLPREKLLELVGRWNSYHPKTPIPPKSKHWTSEKIWAELNKRMKAVCGSGQEWCWAKKLQVSNVSKFYRPEKPEEWIKNKSTWLSSTDIDKVMKQYEKVPGLGYKFLGWMPVDFASSDDFGTCLYAEMCSTLVEPLYTKGIRSFGAIFNLDKHDQPGSHWVSLLISMDSKHPMFGANFYDSTGRKPPKEIVDFMEKIKKQWSVFMPGVKLPLRRNQARHQFGNNECGMFAMMLQVIFLETEINKADRMSFDEILALPLDDGIANKMRDVLYRPVS